MTRREYLSLRRIWRAYRKTPEAQGRTVENRSASSPATVYLPPEPCPVLLRLSERERDAIRTYPPLPAELIPNRFAGWRSALATLAATRQRAELVSRFAASLSDYSHAESEYRAQLARIAPPMVPAAAGNPPVNPRLHAPAAASFSGVAA